MPLPDTHLLAKPQFLIEDATRIRFWACNCPSQPANRTLRFVAANRGMFSADSTAAQPTAAPLASTPTATYTAKELAQGAKS
jgi:hypothetical protein